MGVYPSIISRYAIEDDESYESTCLL